MPVALVCWTSTLNDSSKTYRKRRDTMLRTLKEAMPSGCSWTEPQGGLFLWMTVPASIDTVELLKLATQRDVAFVPGSPFWVGGGIHNTLRLNFSNATEEKIITGITRLAETLKQSLISIPMTAERLYSQLRIVSLDVAAAALGGGILAMRVIGSTPRPSFYWLLPVGVWVAYTIDHLLDAHRMGPAAHSPRHRFHYQHATALWTAVAIAAVACAIGGWVGLSWFGLIYAAVMCSLVILHETIIKLTGNRTSPLLVKELGVAVVFTAGVWGMPWLRHRMDTGRLFDWPALLMIQYLFLAIVNLIEFSIYESKIDTAQGQTSFVRGIGRRRAKRIVMALLLIQIPAAAWAIWFYPTRTILTAEVIYLVMTVGLWIVLAFPKFAARTERYRTLGDGVFLLPLLMAFL